MGAAADKGGESKLAWDAEWEGEGQVGTNRDNTAEDDEDIGKQHVLDEAAADGPADDEYDATREESGADANGGLSEAGDPTVSSPLLQHDTDADDEHATTMAASSVALSTHSNFRF